MPASVYRWLLVHPLFRGSVLSLAVAGFCVACLFVTAPTPSAVTPVIAAVATNPTPAVDNRAEWPRTVLRLWFLLPHFLPLYDR